MIQIIPIQDQQREEQILKTLLKKGENNGRVLVMTEGNEELGTVALKIVDRKLVIIKFSLANNCDFENLSMEEEFFIDTLMRSAASYAETNGANFIETETNEYNKFFAKKGFEILDTHAFAVMSKIVHYT